MMDARERQRLAARLPLAVLLAVTLAVFARTVAFGFVNWDDPSHFADNPLAAHPLARGWLGLFSTREIGYPAPLLLLSFALDRVLFGMDAPLYHAENVALHLADVALLYALARRMRLSPWEAFAAVLLFAVHPLVAEPVSWVTGRKDVLSTAMVLLAALVASGDEAPRAWRWIAANVLVAASVLVLPRMVVGAPVVAILVYAARPAWGARRVAARMAPALAFAAAVVVAGTRQMREVGALPAPRTAGEVVADVTAAWALQLRHVAWPVDLLAYYFREPGDPSTAAMIAAPLATAAGLALLAWKVPSTRAGIALALVAYAPGSCLLAINRWTSDSYMYLPLVGLGLALGPALVRAWPPRLAVFGRAAAGVFVAVLALLAYGETGRWSSSTAVWSGSIAQYPDRPLSYEHEALGLLADGRTAEANAVFIALAERFPDWPDTLDDEVRAYRARGDEARARAVLERGVRAGSVPCVRMYWLDLLASGRRPDPAERDLVAAAFRNGYGDMKEHLHDPVALARIAAILRAMELDDMAAQVDPLVAAARAR